MSTLSSAMSTFEMETHAVPSALGTFTRVSLNDPNRVPEAIASLLLGPRPPFGDNITDIIIEDFYAALEDRTNETVASIHAAARSMLQQMREHSEYAENFHPYRDADEAIWGAEVVFNATYDMLRKRTRRALQEEFPAYHQNALDQAAISAVGQMSKKVSFWMAIEDVIEEEKGLEEPA